MLNPKELDKSTMTFIEQFVNSRIAELKEEAKGNSDLVIEALWFVIAPHVSNSRTFGDGMRLLQTAASDLVTACENPAYIYKGITDEIKPLALEHFIKCIRAYIVCPSNSFARIIKKAREEDNNFLTKNPYLFVRSITGEKIPLEAEPSDTIQEIKKRYERTTGKTIIGSQTFKWIFAGKTLQDSSTLMDYCIFRNTTIHEVSNYQTLG